MKLFLYRFSQWHRIWPWVTLKVKLKVTQMFLKQYWRCLGGAPGPSPSALLVRSAYSKWSKWFPNNSSTSERIIMKFLEYVGILNGSLWLHFGDDMCSDTPETLQSNVLQGGIPSSCGSNWWRKGRGREEEGDGMEGREGEGDIGKEGEGDGRNM